jgi:hypothetical protein
MDHSISNGFLYRNLYHLQFTEKIVDGRDFNRLNGIYNSVFYYKGSYNHLQAKTHLLIYEMMILKSHVTPVNYFPGPRYDTPILSIHALETSPLRVLTPEH